MFGFIKEKDYFHPLVVWLAFLFWYLIIVDPFFPSPRIKLENFITEQSFWFFSQAPKEAEEITIVAIDEASRRHLNLKWPWKRSTTARLIRDITSLSPEVIGLDIVFSGKSREEEDRTLISAFKSHPKIVLAYVLHRDYQEKPIKDFIDATASIGFVNKPLQTGVIDKAKVFHIKDGKEVVFSLELEILLHYLGLDKAELEVKSEGIFLKDELFVPSPQGTIPLNYLVHPMRFRIVPASSVFERTANPLDIKDKIVLVGVTDPLIHDEYPTPLGVSPGVTIIANSLVMLMSKRFLYKASTAQNVLLMVFLGVLIIFTSRRLRFLRNTLFTLSLLVLTIFSFIYLRAKDIHFSYLPILFSGTTAYLVPNLYKYLNLLYLSNRLKNLAITDPLTGFYSLRFFLLQLEEKLKSKDDMVFVALRMANYKRLTLRLNFEQIKLMSRLFAEQLQSEVKNHFQASMFSRLSNDTLGMVIEGTRTGEVETFLRAFVEKAKALQFDLKTEKVRVTLQGCVIKRTRKITGGSDDMITQMETAFKKTKEDQITVAELEEVSGEERATRQKDILDFLAYDWEERTKDLEKGLREILEANKQLDRLNWGALTALARAIDAKSEWTAGHSERVTKLALKIGRAMGFGQEELDNLHRAGLLHDIGKIGTPAELIDKHMSLTDEEHQVIREHPKIGERILEPIEAYAEVIPLVKQHHEWFNGMGYPDGLAGEAIHLGARILAVADVYDAMSSERPYRAAMEIDQVLQNIREKSGSHFDPVVVDALVAVVENERKPEKDAASQVSPLPERIQKNSKLDASKRPSPKS